MKIPIRFDYYLNASCWWMTFFQSVPKERKTIITEYCSGWAPKIYLGAVAACMTGRYFAVDASEVALATFQRLTSLVIPTMKLYTCASDILVYQATVSDIVMLNHALEDVVLQWYCQSNNVQLLDVYADINQLKKIWLEIQNYSDLVKVVKEQAAALFHVLQKTTKKTSLVVIAQYPGYQEELHQLYGSIHVGKMMLHELDRLCLSQQWRDRRVEYAHLFNTVEHIPFNQSDFRCWSVQ